MLQESDCFEDVDVEVFSSMSRTIFEILEFLFWTVFFFFLNGNYFIICRTSVQEIFSKRLQERTPRNTIR